MILFLGFFGGEGELRLRLRLGFECVWGGRVCVHCVWGGVSE